MKYEDIKFMNTHAVIYHWKNSLKGAVVDFAISFKHEEHDVRKVIRVAKELVKHLLTKFCEDGKRVKGTLVAKVRYMSIKTLDEVVYHHTSAPSEEITDPEEFFERHMLRIGSRLDNFNRHGSCLLLQSIEAVHLQLSTCG